MQLFAMGASAAMQSSASIVVLIALTVTFGIGAQILGRFFKIPSIVFLLLFGLFLGPSATGWVDPSLLGNEGLEALISLAVAIVLFEGGLTLDLGNLSELSTSLRNLATIGAAIAFAGGGVVAHYIGGLSWSLAFLYAALVVVTGPTTIGPLLEQVRVDRQVAALLEGEGVFIDPIGAFLAILVLDTILENPAPTTLVGNFLARIAIGVVLGASVGWGLTWALKRVQVLNNNLKNLAVLAGVWSLFAFSQTILDEAGLMSAVVAGIAASDLSSDLDASERRSLERFQGQLTVLSVSVLFILLSANLSLASLRDLGWGSWLAVLGLIFIVRPLSVWICTWGSDFNWRQKAFVSWVAPKGIVSISMASLFAIYLDGAGVAGGDTVKALVFLTIIATVFLQSLSAQWVANLLHVIPAEANGTVVVGAHALACLLVGLLRARGEPVMQIDTSTEEVAAVEAGDFANFFSETLTSEALADAGLGSVGTFLAMTGNGELDYLLARSAVKELDPPCVLALCPTAMQERLGADDRVYPALACDVDLATWDQYYREGNVSLVEVELGPGNSERVQAHLPASIAAGKALPLLLTRQNCPLVARPDRTWNEGDRLLYLLYEPGVASEQLVGRRLSLESALPAEKLPTPSAGAHGC